MFKVNINEKIQILNFGISISLVSYNTLFLIVNKTLFATDRESVDHDDAMEMTDGVWYADFKLNCRSVGEGIVSAAF